MNNSNFWLKYEPEGKFNLLELANTQRAITNFVKILTEREIKVDFQSNNDADSFTNGKRITISSTITMNTIDSVVGTALHEAAHCKYTDFHALKHLKNIFHTWIYNTLDIQALFCKLKNQSYDLLQNLIKLQ